MKIEESKISFWIRVSTLLDRLHDGPAYSRVDGLSAEAGNESNEKSSPSLVHPDASDALSHRNLTCEANHASNNF